MASIKAMIEVPVEVATVFQYLRSRGEGQAYQSACKQVKGYIPPVAQLEKEVNKKIQFSVAGRDSLLRLWMGGWTWTFELEDLGNSTTRITIDYSWHWTFALLGFGTLKQQAQNALIKDVLAIEALAFRAK
jgi:hypothetical protein